MLFRSVLLLDEIEKAHPDLYNVLLQIMDHGKLTDHNGKKVDFRNVILIMTTNAGAQAMARQTPGFMQSGPDLSKGKEAIERMFSLNDWRLLVVMLVVGTCAICAIFVGV